jgi:pimeloyl-ACP methyl ester carboxylesterase
VDLWATWSAITVPRLVLRGADSDLLDPATLARMAHDGAATLTVPDCGHAPALMDAPTMQVVGDFVRAE